MFRREVNLDSRESCREWGGTQPGGVGSKSCAAEFESLTPTGSEWMSAGKAGASPWCGSKARRGRGPQKVNDRNCGGVCPTDRSVEKANTVESAQATMFFARLRASTKGG